MNIWQISPGHVTDKLWPEFAKEGIIAIGWELDNLMNYDRGKLSKEIQIKYNEGRNSVNSCWDFSREIKEGDIIVAKKGSSKEIYGIGVARTKYKFDEKRKYYNHVIEVTWAIKFDKRIKVDIKKRFVQWTVGKLNEETYDLVKKSILRKFPETKKNFDELERTSKELMAKSQHEQKDTMKSEETIKDYWGEQYMQLHNEGRIEFITFHPSYGYEEFVEGITVNTEAKSEEAKSEEICYIRKWGIFKKICTKALAHAINEKLDTSKEPWKDQWAYIYEKYLNKIKDKPREKIRNEIWNAADKFVLIIDEINRGDISKIFGELVTLIENDKRLAQENEIVVQLPYSNDEFGVPPNLHIIGTMNTADRSIALVDIALRRRFGFVEMKPDFDVLMAEHIEKHKEELQKKDVYQYLIKSVEAVKKVNGNIIKDLGRDKQIGHSFFFKVNGQENLMMVWQYEILPLLEEYYYCNYDKIIATLGMKSDNPYVNMNDGIKGFKKIEELNDFLNLVLNVTGTGNE